MLWLPAAERNEHDRSNPWTEKTDPKGCLHTTEGSDWPTYSSWTIMPHATVKPSPGKGVTVRQHLPFDQGSFALRNLAGGVQTNRDYVFQFELIGTCDTKGPGYYWPNADAAVLADLFRKVIEPLSVAFGIPLRARPFRSYPASYGNSPVRMSGASFDTWSGWLGHQHVPENVHGDPGAFPWDRMIAASKGDDDMPTPEALWGADIIPVTMTANASKNPTYSAQNALGRVVDRSEQIWALLVKSTAADAARDAVAAAAIKALADGGGLTAAEAEAAGKAGALAALAELGGALLDTHTTGA